MQSRNRTRTRTDQYGTISSISPAGDRTVIGSNWTVDTLKLSCDDFYLKGRRFDGTLPPSDLLIRRQEIVPASISMRSSYFGVLKEIWEDCPMAPWSAFAESPPGGWSSLELSDTEYVSRLLARSNPYAYTVSIPIMISELTDVASLLRVAGANALASAGKAWLTNEFGIQPFMSDIRSLYNITAAIEKKIIDLNKLIKKGGLRVKVYLGKKSYTDSSWVHNSWSIYGKSFGTRYTPTYTSKVWGTCRWRPGPLSEINTSKLVSFNNALRIVLDLKNPDASTIWEMIPFSWLVDYFLNVGDSLQAVEQSDLVEPYDICIMRTRTIESDIKAYPSPWWSNPSWEPWQYSVSFRGGKLKYVEKRRRADISPPVGFSSLLAYGFMNIRQAQNLTALLLSVNRFRI